MKAKTHRIPTGGERYPGHVVLRNHVPRVHADQRQVLARDGQRDVGAGVLHVRRVRYALEDAFVDAPFLRRFETSGFAYPVDAFPDKAKIINKWLKQDIAKICAVVSSLLCNL